MECVFDSARERIKNNVIWLLGVNKYGPSISRARPFRGFIITVAYPVSTVKRTTDDVSVVDAVGFSEGRIRVCAAPRSVGVHAMEDDLDPAFECTVCTDLFLDPVTAPCGHSFCRRCLARSLDHKPECPLCRAQVFGAFAHDAKVSVTIQEIIERQVPENVRAARAARAEASTPGPEDTAPMSMFVMVAVIPEKDTGMNLVIFEPRYRLMIRRAMEGSRRFGMMAPDSDSATEVELARVDPLPDGRFHITIVPTGRRVRVISSDADESGYLVGHVRDVTDASDSDAAAYMRRAEELIERETVNHPSLGDIPVLRLRNRRRTRAEANDTAARWFAEHLCELHKQLVTAPFTRGDSFERDIFCIGSAEMGAYDPATDDREHLKRLPEFQEGGSGTIPIADVSLEVFMREFHFGVKRAIKYFGECTYAIDPGARNNMETLKEAIEPRKWDDPDTVSWSLSCAEDFSWKMCNAVAGLDLIMPREFSGSRTYSSFCAIAVGSQSVRERLVLCRALLLQVERIGGTANAEDEDEDEDEDEEVRRILEDEDDTDEETRRILEEEDEEEEREAEEYRRTLEEQDEEILRLGFAVRGRDGFNSAD